MSIYRASTIWWNGGSKLKLTQHNKDNYAFYIVCPDSHTYNLEDAINLRIVTFSLENGFLIHPRQNTYLHNMSSVYFLQFFF